MQAKSVTVVFHFNQILCNFVEEHSHLHLWQAKDKRPENQLILIIFLKQLPNICLKITCLTYLNVLYSKSFKKQIIETLVFSFKTYLQIAFHFILFLIHEQSKKKVLSHSQTHSTFTKYVSLWLDLKKSRDRFSNVGNILYSLQGL